MKTLITTIFISVNGLCAFAQNSLSQQTQVEVATGLVLPNFGKGNELLRSSDLRTNGQSYFQNSAGNRANVGKYGTQQGFNISLGFYKPVRAVKGLMLGGMIRSAQTGSEPDNGGYAEGYFFNFLSAGLAAKYYPFTSNNLYLKGEAGMGAVFTKNRYLNEAGQQNFFHQFGIGTSGSFGAGYSLTPFKNKDKAIDLSVLYQAYSTRVEVNGIGDDQWRFGALNFLVGLTF
ncbi:hypothetical protein ACFSUS_13150 [Spirosoma soli]|uniref:Outer membrane beta-barrel protein n=1 Tax=Spirosoma soli TaxID=1770529 RepID=A0ABW5M3Q5_9BACT